MGLVGSFFFWTNLLPVSLLRVLCAFFQCVTIVNLRIAYFNLLPFPTLDGFGVVAAFLPDKLLYKINQHRFYILLAFMFLLFVGVLSDPVNFLTVATYQLIAKITGVFAIV